MAVRENRWLPISGSWLPLGAERTNRFEVGMLVAYEYAVWRVIDIEPRPRELWSESDIAFLESRPNPSPYLYPHTVTIRPLFEEKKPFPDRSKDLHFKAGGSGGVHLYVYPNEHYPVCAECGDPMPCRGEMAREVAAFAAERMERYATEGVCPECQEPARKGQQRITFDENLVVPLGPPVTFHLSGSCRGAAIEYEKRWVARNTKKRRPKLYDPKNLPKVGLGGVIHASAKEGPRSMMRITGRGGRPKCRCGCGKRATHLGLANGVTLTGGCEQYVRWWVEHGYEGPPKERWL